MKAFIAAYPGTCADCGKRFGAGAEIVWRGRLAEVSDYVHAVCPESAIDQQRPACPTCHLELPVSGVCGAC